MNSPVVEFIEAPGSPDVILYASEEQTSNLKLFLHEPSARSLTTIQIVQMAAQVASAIAHLHSHQVLHKDVAARNCV